ncbi:3-methyl-2-oxobutanoate hydroxymethyltransferase [Candidatus Bipolaricaulota bacterium]|nr:3-methyl-2-oxobutanoate hydroxymethyltransferase [Candidatus Bipolaricaulota bacterium]
MADRDKIDINYLYSKKAEGEKISWLTAYDYPMAKYEEEAGIEMILVGDSGGMTQLGYDSTLPVTMDEMTMMTKAVTRATETTFVVGDMPYMSYQPDRSEAIKNAGRFMGECGTDAVKLEGGRRMAPTVEAIVNAGIPVVGHIGMTPQSAALLGGYKSQGRDAETAKGLIADARALEDAGSFAILLEAVPTRVAKIIYEESQVPIYGIGAGKHVDGQLLIAHDILGLFELFKPRFVKRYAALGRDMVDAVARFKEEVKGGEFPDPEHSYGMPDEEYDKLV